MSQDGNQTGYALALVLSVLVHALVLLALLFVTPPAMPTPSNLEASFVSAAELAEAQSALAAANAPDQAQIKTAAQLQRYNEALAQKEAAYRAQIAEFAKQIDAQSERSIDELMNELATQQQLEEQALGEARAAFEQKEALVADNQRQLDEARLARDQAAEQAAKDAKQGGGQVINVVAGDGTKTAPSAGASGSDKQSLQAAVSAHIKRFWQPIGEVGTRLVATIKVDASGNVLSVGISGGTELQRQGLERAIYAASPITPIIGTEYRSLSPHFIVQ